MGKTCLWCEADAKPTLSGVGGINAGINAGLNAPLNAGINAAEKGRFAENKHRGATQPTALDTTVTGTGHDDLHGINAGRRLGKVIEVPVKAGEGTAAGSALFSLVT